MFAYEPLTQIMTSPGENKLSDAQTSSMSFGAKRVSVTTLSKGFVVFACLSLLVLDGWQAWNAREIRLRETEVVAANLARSLAQHAEDTVKQADTVLVGLIERLETDGTAPAPLNRLHHLLVTQVAELPKLHGLFVYDAQGRWLVNSQPTLNRRANNSDREYFIHHRENADTGPFIGRPVHSRSTGEWIIPVSRRINRPDGSFAGVALATIHMSYFSKYYGTFNIGEKGTIFLAHASGYLVLRHPFLDDRVGRDMKNTLLFREYLPKMQAGTYTSKNTMVDEMERIFAFHRTPVFPLVAGATMSKKEVLETWWQDAFKQLLSTAALVLVLGYLGFRLTRQIAFREHAERALRVAQNDLESLNRELEKMAMQDGLTGLGNRRLFDITLNEEFGRAMRSGDSLALIMIDVDAFKKFNDAYGHPEGDECLRKIARAVSESQNRPGDFVARYGGEEIAVLLPDTDLAGAVAVAERIRLAVRGLGIPHPSNPAGVVTISCGVDAMVPVRHQSIPTDLLQAADSALYLAKSSGRDHVVSRLSELSQN